MSGTLRAVQPAEGIRAGAFFDRLWRTSPPLAAVGAVMIVAAAASVVGMVVDPRIITGAPAWLKPFKFAVSTAVYSLTLAWIFGLLPDWPRVRRVVGWTTAIVFVLEVVIIDAQAWRGTTSHFKLSDRAADDAPNGGATSGRPRWSADDDCRRALGRRNRWRSRRTGNGVEPGAW